MKPVGLKRLPFFGGLPRWALVRLAEAEQEEELPAGRTVLHQHDRTRTSTSCPPAHSRSTSVSVTTTYWWRCWVTRASWSAFRPPYRATASVRCEQPSRLISRRSRPGPRYSPAPARAAPTPTSGAPRGRYCPWWMTSIISGTVVLLMRGRPCLTPEVTS